MQGIPIIEKKKKYGACHRQQRIILVERVFPAGIDRSMAIFKLVTARLVKHVCCCADTRSLWKVSSPHSVVTTLHILASLVLIMIDARL